MTGTSTEGVETVATQPSAEGSGPGDPQAPVAVGAGTPGKPKKGRWVSVGLWALSILLTLACFMYQDKTGPTYPLENSIDTAKGKVSFTFLRSENLGTDLKVMLNDPVPAGVTASVKYRRYRSHDVWSMVDMKPGDFEFSRRGSVAKVKGVGVELPSLDKRAGKYEYYVLIDDGSGEPFSITGDKPIYARYKGAVPMPVLGVHILVIFASMMFALRTVFEALRRDGNFKWMMWATTISLILGAFVMGPLVQWYAFRVWWSGVPFGFDWTDNKVLVELLAWFLALFLNRGDRRNRWSVLLAGAVTLVVYFIPHSIFGSEYDFTKGAGRGTAG
ncbi:MAG TPA: hypothetical protein VFG89_09525 [Coriobacteriia bacterium]|nr:hypothetical protein [Coriobacteriia bacterium]